MKKFKIRRKFDPFLGAVQVDSEKFRDLDTKTSVRDQKFSSSDRLSIDENVDQFVHMFVQDHDGTGPQTCNFGEEHGCLSELDPNFQLNVSQ